MITMWIPNLSSVEVKKGNGLLSFALKRSGREPISQLKDNSGIFAFRIKDGILTAKSYIYGNIVSSHKRAVISAYNSKLPLLMYIGNQDKFYRFNPETIIHNSEENKRGKEIMLNWNIKLGVRWL